MSTRYKNYCNHGKYRSWQKHNRNQERSGSTTKISAKNGTTALLEDIHEVDASTEDGATERTGKNSEVKPGDVDKATDVKGKHASLGGTDAYMYTDTDAGTVRVADDPHIGIAVVVRGGIIITADYTGPGLVGRLSYY